MSKVKSIIKKAFTNSAILYITSRYATYFIQFINSLFIAVYLGPYYLGIWGFINLVIGYISQLNFGISNSVNVYISINKQNKDYVKKIIGNGLTMILGLSFVILLFLMVEKMGIIQLGVRYNFSNYVLPISIIAILTHINGYLSNIFRVFGKISTITINQSLYPVIVLFLIPFFRGENLLWAMLYANTTAFVLSFILFLIQSPIKLKLLFEWNIFKLIQIKGWHLFVYNASFYLIILTTNTFISGNYEVREFGYYTFSYSLANVVLLLLNSISFLIFPKMLNRFANSTNEQISNLLTNIRTAYITLSHLLIHFVIMLFPFFLFFFPDYGPSSSAFKYTALTVVLYTNSFGYQGVLMAKGKEKQIAIIAFGALMFNVILGAILVYWIKVPFSMVILATLVSYLVYVFILGVLGRKVLELKASFVSVIKDVYPWRMMLPFAISLSLNVFSVSNIYFIIPFLLYLLLNFKDLLKIKDLGVHLIKNPNLINI